MYRQIKTEEPNEDYQGRSEDVSDPPLIMNCEPERDYVRYCHNPDVRTLYTRDTSVQTDHVLPVDPIDLPLEQDTYEGHLASAVIQSASQAFGDLQGQRTSKRNSRHYDHEDRKFACDYCEKRFKYPRAAVIHMATHNKKPRQSTETKYQCNVCFKYYTQSNSLKTHMRLHTGEKPYRCEYCDKRYADQANFRKHLKIHNKGDTGVSNRRTPNQVKILQGSPALTIIPAPPLGAAPEDHRPPIDHRPPMYKCSLCPEKFLYESDLPLHIKHAHAQPDNRQPDEGQSH